MAVGRVSILFLLIAIVSQSLAQSNHFEMGKKGVNDRRLHYEIVQKSSSVLQIVTKDIVFPMPGNSNFSPISYILATDQYVNGNGGYCSLLSGGLGFNAVKLHFKSQRGHGFNFILEIWGP